MKKLSEKLGRLLIMQNKTLSTAESCTGGMIAKIITDVPGSSRYFMGGVVSYSNDVKIKALHVDRAMIDKYGAVSSQVARAMAQGVRQFMKTGCAIAVTGIAGPDGGTRKKPVGLVYIAVDCGGKFAVKRFHFKKKRDGNRRLSAKRAIEMLIELLTC